MRLNNFVYALAGAVAGTLAVSLIAYAAVSTLTLGTNGSVGGAIVLNGQTSGASTLSVPAAAGTGTTFNLPATNGANTNVLQTDGSGNTSWTAAGSGNAATGGGTTGSPQAFTGVNSFNTVWGTIETVTLTTNNYTIVEADCGKLKVLPTGTTPTVTLPAAMNHPCAVKFVTSVAISYNFIVGGSATKINSQAFYHTRGTNAGDTVVVEVVTPSATVAAWNVAGDVTS